VSPAAIDEGRTLKGLGIEERSVQAIVPTYLWRFRRTGQFKSLRLG
jgi:NADH dehydrogenase